MISSINIKGIRPAEKLKRKNPARGRVNRNGFTLLEVIIVITIIAAIVTLAVPKLFKRGTEVRTVVRRIGVINRELKNRAKLMGATYRLALRMRNTDSPSNGREPRIDSFWVEKAPGQILNDYDPEKPPVLADELDEDERKKLPPQVFQIETAITKKPEELPEGMIFDRVELSSLKEPVTDGIVYVHYLPSGYADEAAIHINYDNALKWTLAIQPLTGRIDILNEDIPLKELQGK